MSERRRQLALETAMRFAGTAAFPRLAYLLRWPTRLGPRGLTAYIAFVAISIVALRAWATPYLERMAAEGEPGACER